MCAPQQRCVRSQCRSRDQMVAEIAISGLSRLKSMSSRAAPEVLIRVAPRGSQTNAQKNSRKKRQRERRQAIFLATSATGLRQGTGGRDAACSGGRRVQGVSSVCVGVLPPTRVSCEAASEADVGDRTLAEEQRKQPRE